MYFPDVMVDVETTGTDPSHSHILQISAVRFNLAEKTIDTSSMFDRCLYQTTPHRFWDSETRIWWNNQRAEVLQDILDRAEPPNDMIEAFNLWVCQTPSDRPLHFWSKPISFDFMFISSYFKQYGLRMPFGYWLARDVNTHIAAKTGADPKELWAGLEFEGDKHNALHDCIHQIKGLFAT